MLLTATKGNYYQHISVRDLQFWTQCSWFRLPKPRFVSTANMLPNSSFSSKAAEKNLFMNHPFYYYRCNLITWWEPIMQRYFHHHNYKYHEKGLLCIVFSTYKHIFQDLIQNQCIFFIGTDEGMKGACDCIEIERKQTNKCFSRDHRTIVPLLLLLR